MTQQYSHDKSNEEQFILKLLLENEVFLRNYYGKVTADVFSPKYKALAKVVLEYYKQKKSQPNRKILEDFFIAKIDDVDTREKTLKHLDELYKMEIDHTEIMPKLKEEIDTFIQERLLINKLLLAYAELTDGGGKTKAIGILKEAMQIDFSDSLGLNYFEDLETRAERIQANPDVAIDTGLAPLTELLGGGYRKKAFFVFAGPANSGKSLILNDAAVHLVMKKYNVLYVCLELSEDYTAQRTDANFGGMPMNDLNARPVDGIKKALAKYKSIKDNGGDVGVLWYKEYPPDTVTSLDIVAMMRNIQTKRNIKFDFLIIDYLKLVNPAGKIYGENMYSKLTTVCQEVRKVAMEENVCVLSASQTNRASYGSTSVGMENLSDSIGIAQTADAVITIGRDASLDSDDTMLLTVAKSRFSKKGASFLAKVHYDYMRMEEDKSLHKTILNGKHKEASSTDSTVKKTKKSEAELWG